VVGSGKRKARTCWLLLGCHRRLLHHTHALLLHLPSRSRMPRLGAGTLTLARTHLPANWWLPLRHSHGTGGNRNRGRRRPGALACARDLRLRAGTRGWMRQTHRTQWLVRELNGVEIDWGAFCRGSPDSECTSPTRTTSACAGPPVCVVILS
jgi:hypothetical protein